VNVRERVQRGARISAVTRRTRRRRVRASERERERGEEEEDHMGGALLGRSALHRYLGDDVTAMRRPRFS
jgi:hypothetical protein